MEKPILEKDALINLLRKVLRARRRFMINGIIGAVIGVVFALGVVKTYTSTIVLAPEMSDGQLGGGGLGSLAAMAGINLGASSTDAIYPELYPQMIESTPFIVDLMDVRVKSMDGEIDTDLYDYVATKQKVSFTKLPLRLLGAGVKKVVDLVSSPIELPATSDKINPFCLTKQQEEVAKYINQVMVSANVNKKDQIITLTVTSQDPLISAMLVDSVRERLQESITDYRTKKARHDLLYSEGLLKEAKAEYDDARNRYVAYAEAHQDPFLQSAKTKTADLENEMSLAFNTYSQMLQQYNAAKAKVQERTPSFTTIQPASVSVKPSSTPKLTVLILWIILSQIATFVWVVSKDSLSNWRKQLRAKA